MYIGKIIRWYTKYLLLLTYIPKAAVGLCKVCSI